MQVESAAEPRVESEAVSAVETPKGSNSRRAAVVFVAVFLACTFSLLVGYRYMGGTTFMDWYLYQIANQTRMVLSVVGEKCSIESPELYRGRTDEVRAALHSKADASTPLSAWELWRYRAVSSREEARKAEDAFLAFTAAPWAPPADFGARPDYYRERLTRIQKALNPSGATAAARIDPETGAQINGIGDALARLAQDGGLTPEQRAQRSTEIDGALLDTEIRVAAVLERRAVEMAAKAREEGPRITFVARAGTERRIRDLELERTRLETDASPDAKRLAVVDAQLSELNAKAAQESGKEKDYAFVFRVVADCGAIPSMAIFLSAVLAFPAKWRSRLKGIFIGIPVLYAINIVRLACLAGLGSFVGPGQVFDFAHHYVWQGIYIVFVVAVWLLWVEFMVTEKPSCQTAAQ